MGLADLYLARPTTVFSGVQTKLENSFAIVLGAPFDYTTSYRTGAREGPRSIREASANIEFYSLRGNIDVDKLPVFDAGDVSIVVNTSEYMRRLTIVAEELAKEGKPLIVLGGEHTITYGVIAGLKKDEPCILVLDAHFDLRDEFMGLKLGHATVMRRLVEIVGSTNIFFVGTRAFAEEELEYARAKSIPFLTPGQIRMLGTRETVRRILSWLEHSECNSLYISVDMDFFDPGYAPGVSNPEPEGLEPWHGLDIVYYVTQASSKPPLAIDIVEHTPVYDCGGAAATLAAKIIVEWLAANYRRRERGQNL